MAQIQSSNQEIWLVGICCQLSVSVEKSFISDELLERNIQTTLSQSWCVW